MENAVLESWCCESGGTEMGFGTLGKAVKRTRSAKKAVDAGGLPLGTSRRRDLWPAACIWSRLVV
jgi:hypothetical protein